jgi:hypothetical protein
MLEDIIHSAKSSISAIIPAYNEERNIAGVLEVLQATDFLKEIIVVDDGSTDSTARIVEQAAERDRRFHLLRHEKNHGKGQAIFTAWAHATAPYFLLLDADMHDLTPLHLQELILPVISRRADMTLGLFTGGHLNTDLSHRLTPYLTGQRGLRAELLKYVSPEAAAGYGFEVALTIAARQQDYRVENVPLVGVWHPPSEFRGERGGYWYGKLWRFRMYGQILRAWTIATRYRYPTARAFFSSILKP